jgi:flagellar assembly protein FliH
MATVITKEHVGLHEVKRCSFEELIEILNSKTEDCQHEEILKEFKKSVKKFEERAKVYNLSLEKLEPKMVDIALEIAREVVSVELDKSSADIAIKLGSELIKELQNASKIKLKVNPKDYEAILGYLGQLSHVEIMADSEVNIGGVIALSDTKEIDAQISKRFKKVKKVVMDCKNK